MISSRGKAIVVIAVLAALAILGASTSHAATWTGTNVDGTNSIFGVSCAPSSSLCVAGDGNGNILSSTDSGATWSSPALVDNQYVLGISPGYEAGNINAVSCPSATHCFAVDNLGNLISNTVDPTNASDWQITQVDNTDTTSNSFSPPNNNGCGCNANGLDENGNAYYNALPSLSCPSAGVCLAGDWSGNIVGSSVPGGWGTQNIARGAQTEQYCVPYPYGCSSPSYLTSAETVNNSNQTLIDNSVASGPSSSIGNDLAVLSCPTTSFCAAGDYNGNILTTSTPNDPNSWTTPFSIDDPNNAGLTALTCASTSLCVAGDGAGNLIVSTNPTAGSSATWKLLHADTDPGAFNNNYITAISCPSTSLCVATDFYGNTVTSTNPTDTGSDMASQWAFNAVPFETSFSHANFDSLTCPSTSYCVGGDSQGNILTTSDPADTAPSNVVLPVVSGNVAVGSTITTDTGTWAGSPTITYTYQWEDCDSTGCTNATGPGATTNSYTIQPGDEYTDPNTGQSNNVDVVVTATNSFGSSSATGSSSPVGAPFPTSPPTVSGSATNGSTLTATAGTFSGDTPITDFWTWEDCDSTGNNCTSIAGAANTDTYTLQSSDVGSTVIANDTASNAAGGYGVNSAPTAVVTDGGSTGTVPTSPDTPTLSTNAPAYNTSLSVSTGTGSAGTPAPTYTYQWQSCPTTTPTSCTDLSGATGTSYVPTASDVGNYLRAGVTATNLNGSATSYSDESTAGVTGIGPITPSTPSLSTNSPVVASTISSSPGTGSTVGRPSPAPNPTYIYQWQSCTTTDTSTCTDIPGASSISYVPVSSDVGKYLRVGVEATNSTGTWVDPTPPAYSPESGNPTLGGGGPATSGSVSIYGQVNPGTLSTSPGPPSPLGYDATHPWTTTLLTTGNTSASYSEPVGAYDDTGSGNGWHETITSTEYTGISGAAVNQGGHSANPFEFGASGDSSLPGATDETSTLGTISTSAIADSYVASPGDAALGAIPQGGSTGGASGAVGTEPVGSVFYDAALGTGMGDFNLTLPVSVVIPADAYTGVYQSTETFAIVSGP